MRSTDTPPPRRDVQLIQPLASDIERYRAENERLQKRVAALEEYADNTEQTGVEGDDLRALLTAASEGSGE